MSDAFLLKSLGIMSMCFADHHPDLHLVGWNDVTIEIWTHAVGEPLPLIQQLFIYFCFLIFCDNLVFDCTL